ncbi:MAG: right-handed parallel beta-helix repeat-containing protein [Pseudomonadota bacterium]
MPDLRLARTLLSCLMLVALLPGCGPDAPGPAPEEAARLAAAAGDLPAAIEGYRTAIRQRPDDIRLRLELSELLLQSGDGASAEGLLRRAVSMGVHERRVQVGLARAAFLQGQWPELLAITTVREGLPAADRFELLLFHAHAQLRISNVSTEAIRETFHAAFGLLDDFPDTLDAPDAWARLAQVRKEWPQAEAAYQHFRCAGPAEALDDAPPVDPGQRVLKVGPSQTLKTPSAAARVAQDGDVIEIDAAVYRGDVAVWKQNNLLIRGVGGRPHLRANGRNAQGKAIWVLEGENTRVENIEFSGARVRDRNGAGIRLQGDGLEVTGCYFHHNENGILTNNSPTSEVVVRNTEFAHNGHGDGLSHNIYVGQLASFVMEGSYSHHARVGHLVKSRAARNIIRYNRLMDEDDGTSSYLIDLPEGGNAVIVGNELMKGPRSENPAMIAFGAERQGTDAEGLYVVNNTFYSRYLDATFVHNHTTAEAVVANNLMAGAPGRILAGPGGKQGNMMRPGLGLADPASFDFRILAGSPAIDAGVAVSVPGGDVAVPMREYTHVAGSQPRPAVWTVDVGAREYCEATAPRVAAN